MIGKREKPPKILTGRLKLLDMIAGNFLLGKNYEGVIKFAIKYADDKNGDVRNAAIGYYFGRFDELRFHCWMLRDWW